MRCISATSDGYLSRFYFEEFTDRINQLVCDNAFSLIYQKHEAYILVKGA